MNLQLIEEPIIAPCGCKFAMALDDSLNKIFVTEPCSPSCQYLQYVIDETNKRNNPLLMQDGEMP